MVSGSVLLAGVAEVAPSGDSPEGGQHPLKQDLNLGPGGSSFKEYNWSVSIDWGTLQRTSGFVGRGNQVTQTRRAQKVSFYIAIISYIAAIGCILASVYYSGELGSDHPVVASFGAAVVFFVGVGIVLHVIGRVDIPDLKIKSGSGNADKSDLK